MVPPGCVRRPVARLPPAFSDAKRRRPVILHPRRPPPSQITDQPKRCMLARFCWQAEAQWCKLAVQTAMARETITAIQRYKPPAATPQANGGASKSGRSEADAAADGGLQCDSCFAEHRKSRYLPLHQRPVGPTYEQKLQNLSGGRKLRLARNAALKEQHAAK